MRNRLQTARPANAPRVRLVRAGEPAFAAWVAHLSKARPALAVVARRVGAVAVPTALPPMGREAARVDFKRLAGGDHD